LILKPSLQENIMASPNQKLESRQSKIMRSEWGWIPLLQAPLLRVLLVVAGIVLGVLLLGSWASAAAGSLLLVLAASILALALHPLVVWLEVRRIPRGVGASLVVLLTIFFLVGTLALIAPMLYTQGSRFVAGAPEMLSRMKTSLPWITQIPGASELLSGKINIGAVLGSGGSSLISGVSLAASGLISTFASLFLMVTMVVFLLANPQPIVRGLLSAIPSTVRAPLERLLSRLGRQLSLWLVAAVTVSIILGTLVAVGLALTGFQNALLFGAIYAVCNLVPVVGPLVGMLPAVLTSVADAQWTAVAWAVVIPIALQQLDGYFLSPMVFRRTTQLQPLSVLVSVSVFGSLMGFVGTFLAVPMVIIIKAIYEELYLPSVGGEGVSEEDIASVLNVPPPEEPLEGPSEPLPEASLGEPSSSEPIAKVVQIPAPISNESLRS
jgi:putative permease